MHQKQDDVNRHHSLSGVMAACSRRRLLLFLSVRDRVFRVNCHVPGVHFQMVQNEMYICTHINKDKSNVATVRVAESRPKVSVCSLYCSFTSSGFPFWVR